MTESEETLDLMEQRIEHLEKLVFGPAEKDADYPKIIDSLLNVQKNINSSLSGKKKAALLFQKLPELKRCLDHQYTNDLTLSYEAKEEMVLTAYDFLKKQAQLLQSVSENQRHINSEHVQAVPKLSEKLQALSQVQIQQQDDTAEVTEETRKLLSIYNNAISLLSRQFILWDEQVTKLEMQMQKK